MKVKGTEYDRSRLYNQMHEVTWKLQNNLTYMILYAMEMEGDQQFYLTRLNKKKADFFLTNLIFLLRRHEILLADDY